MVRYVTFAAVTSACVLNLFGAQGAGPVVNESARRLPAAYDVDVVVVGGSTGAVAAATAAARSGAKVFLAAPYTYLGEDMTATLRLWLEEGEVPTSPLALRLFAAEAPIAPWPDRANLLPFQYEADRRSADGHKDTAPPSMLCDGAWGDAPTQSVQYDDDVNITVDLLSRQDLQRACVMLYHARDFQVARVTLSASDDKRNWEQAAVINNDQPPRADTPAETMVLSAPLAGKARYLRFFVQRAKGSRRVLLGEIAVFKAGPAAPASAPAAPRMATPLAVKKALDDALLEAKVPFLYGCLATDVIRDAEGRPCGIVMANRSGRQAVLAKVIIDATDRASVARMAQTGAAGAPPREQTFERVVIGGQVREGKGMAARRIEPPFTVPAPARKTKAPPMHDTYPVIQYTLTIPMPDCGFASLAQAEQTARDMTYHPDQQFSSDVLFQVPPDAIQGRKRLTADRPGADKVELDAFRPAGVERLFVLGACAGLPRDQVRKLMRPLALIDVGSRIGDAAAAEARSLPAPREPRVPGSAAAAPVAPGDVRESLTGVRPNQKLPTVPQEARPLPVLGTYDVVVIGGGVSGAPAGIAAARQGAKVLVVEYQHGLGGAGTLGAISNYYCGYRGGFTSQVGEGNSWAIEPKMEWWRRALRQAGADIWLGCIGCGAFADGDKVCGSVVATPQGRGVVLGKVIVDATGNADIAASAGAECMYTDAADIAMQGTGLPPRNLGARYANTDFTIVDETDMVDVWQTLVYAKHKYPRAFDLGKLIDSRERRCVVGDFILTILDQVNMRTFPDTISQAKTNFDTHGYTVDPYFELQTPDAAKWLSSYVPYRCLLPRGLDGILVTGLGVSAHRDAIPLIRMQPDVQNQGYAAGAAAAMAARAGGHTRKIDIRKLQKHLVEIGCLPSSVLTDQDSYPTSDAKIAQAVMTAVNNYEGAAVVLAHPRQSLPLLRQAYADARSEKDKLTCAHILAVMGDPTGLQNILFAVESADKLDKGWQYTGMGQFGRSMSQLDAYMIALGRIGDRRATPVILAKLKLLTAEDAFSHARAMALALEMLGDPAAAGHLAEALRRPRMTGHAITGIDQAIQQGGIANPNETAVRARSLRELMLARALYRCGDKDGLGKKILTEYTRDLRGHIARHAAAVLREGRE